ncbi:serine hydrolase [Danxiaibacter flavus]|uniref:Serine hydrolase n=1 Tax=Danxiaibacter flavus TaxID=3049108 RepID=A0ABV3ZLM6_9BACT|nr:serine hydrolase [Chitinophagaceae bacterium DXS]
MKKVCLSLFTLLVALFGIAQKQIQKANGQYISPKDIEGSVNDLMKAGDVNGIAIAMINDNVPSYIKAFGYSNAEKGIPLDTASAMYAASLAKPLFAYIVMQLVDKGFIALDKPLYTYLQKPLPEYKAYADLAGDERWKLITARHCLTHTTGFPNWRQLNPNNNNKLEIFFTPGSRYAYSGEGLYLLQMVVEAITGKHLETLAQEQIFEPFGMYNTSFVWQPSFEKNYAVGHNMNGDTLAKFRNKESNAAGSMETTVADYARFLSAVLQHKGLSEQSWKEMFSRQIGIFTRHQFPSLNNDTTSANRSIQLSYGLGWGLFNTPYGSAFFKEGHGDGWVHYTICLPDKKSALLIMSNSANGESIFKDLVDKLEGVSIPWEWEGYYPYRKHVTLSEFELKKFVGQYKNERMRAIVTLDKGVLKVEVPDMGLGKTNLYAESDHHFFMKTMEVDLEFSIDDDGVSEKILVKDEGEEYELRRVK